VRTIFRLLTAAAAVALATLGLAAPAQAAPVAFTVWDGGSYEYFKTCSDDPPFTCGTFAHNMYVQVTGPWPPRSQPITLGYVVEPITASPGADYVVPSGTVTIPAGQYVTGIYVTLVADGAAESPETFRVRLTSSSIGGNISDTGIGTIYNDGLIPGDCTLSKPNLVLTSMTCTNRPAGQRWVHQVACREMPTWGYIEITGPVVTGNGTSTVDCSAYPGYVGSSFYVVP
jgi:hypothetical protein